MSNNSNIQNSLFETMKIFSESATANSKATLTLDTRIVEIKDEAAGIYAVEYLGSTFEAHANSDVSYSIDDNVYVLVPDGDFTKEKIILGLISASADVYSKGISSEEEYYAVSDNLIDNDQGIIRLSSYDTIKPEEKKINLTEQEASVFGSLIQNYLNDYRIFKLSLSAKTALSEKQQSGGTYGICLNLPIIESAGSGQGERIETWKKVYLETANFVGAPYRYLVWSPQQVYFYLDEQYEYDSERMPYYSYFCYDFAQDSEKVQNYDIQLKDISLQVVNTIPEESLSGYFLSLKASQGEYYSDFYKNVKTITPSLKINGKESSLKNTSIYWFIEDTEVKSDSEYYSTYGGYGWKCLNTKTNIAYNEDGSQTFDYITTVQSLEVDRSEVRAATRFKCVVIYNKTALSFIITLKNLSVKEGIFLTSSKNLTIKGETATLSENLDNSYIKDAGYVNLSALVFYDGVTNIVDNRGKILYSWARYDKNGNYINDDLSFFTSVANNKIVKIEEKSYFVTQVKFPVNKVEELNTVNCTAKYLYVDDSFNRYEEQIGTASMTISTDASANLNLTINNDNVIYKYDTNGNSPTSSSYDGPSSSKVTSISPLNYTLTYSDGKELSEEEYLFVKYLWKVPKATISLFTLGTAMTPTSEDNNYYYFEGYGKNFNLNYKIANRFNISKVNQAINLTISFKGVELLKSANITFLKEGASGTNGTSYTAVLVSGGSSAGDDASVPYGTLDARGVAQKLKFVYNKDSKILYRHNYSNDTLEDWESIKKRIYPRVWRDGSLLDYNTHYDVEYSMFDEKVTGSCFSIEKKDDGGCLLSLEETPSEDSCNIVQAKITINDGNSSVAQAEQIIYAYYPIEMTIVNCDLDFIPSLDGGFSEVVYSSDGTNPSYDESSNFFVNSKGEDSSEYFNLEWEAKSHLGIYSLNSEGLPIGTKKEGVVNSNSVKVKPDNKYDDGDSKNYIRAKLSFNASKEEPLNEEKEAYKEALKNAEMLLSAEKANLSCIQNVVDEYNKKVKNLYNALTNIRSLLSHETSADYILNKLQNEVIYDLNQYIQLQEQYNEKREIIKAAVAKMQQKVQLLSSQSKLAEERLWALDGTSGASAQDLISLVEYRIILTDSEFAELKEKVGQEIANTLKIGLDRINEQILNYQEEYSYLQGSSCTAQLEEYNQMKVDLRAIANLIPDSSSARYIDFKNVLLAIVLEFNKGVSYNYLFSKLQAIENLFYSIAIINEDHTTVLRESVIEEHNINIATYEDSIDSYTEKISSIDNILGTKDKVIIHIRPIVLYFNRYEMSNINAWDGNKIETGENDTYLLAPQMGAGIKEEDNSFTGLVMGIKNTSVGSGASSTSQVGMFGYNKGNQSIKLDAKTGAAVFGIAGSGGQIVIDPSSSSGSGLLYSSNYWKNYNKTSGMPTSYEKTNTNSQGMLINFSEPSIKFGSGHFTVDADGNMHAGGGGTGDIGGWNIYNTSLQSANYKASRNGICLDAGDDAIIFGSSNGKIYSGGHSSLITAQNGFYLSQDGLSIGSKVKITSDGTVTLGSGAVTNSNKHWTIDANGDNSYLSYGTTSFSDSHGVYLGTDGFRLGSHFKVDTDGSLESSSGYIGGWTITSASLASGNISLNKNGSICHNGGSWSINQDGSATFNNITANNSGSIAGWAINSWGLSKNNIEIRSDGSIKNGNNWSIDSSGNATFKNITCDNTWSFGSGNNVWTNEGFAFNSGTIGGNLATATGLSFSKGTVSLGTSAQGGSGITYNGTTCKIAGDIYANSGYFNGDINATRFAFGSEDEFFTMGYHSIRPLASGFNVGDKGIWCYGKGGISTPSIGGGKDLEENERVLCITGPTAADNLTIASTDALKFINFDQTTKSFREYLEDYYVEIGKTYTATISGNTITIHSTE